MTSRRTLPVTAVAVVLLGVGGCTSSASRTTPQPTLSSSKNDVTELASQACGQRADSGGPPAVKPIGTTWQPDIGAYDASRLFAHRNAVLAGKAAARDPSWGPLALALRDLTDIYETARQEYAAVLAGRATAAERANLRALQDAADRMLETIQTACRRTA